MIQYCILDQEKNLQYVAIARQTGFERMLKKESQAINLGLEAQCFRLHFGRNWSPLHFNFNFSILISTIKLLKSYSGVEVMSLRKL